MTDIIRKKPKSVKAEHPSVKTIPVTMPDGSKFEMKINKKSRHSALVLDSSPATHVAWQENSFVDQTNENVTKLAGLFGNLSDIEE